MDCVSCCFLMKLFVAVVSCFCHWLQLTLTVAVVGCFPNDFCYCEVLVRPKTSQITWVESMPYSHIYSSTISRKLGVTTGKGVPVARLVWSGRILKVVMRSPASSFAPVGYWYWYPATTFTKKLETLHSLGENVLLDSITGGKIPLQHNVL